MEPHHAPRHARKRGGRWLLPALVGSACAVFLLCLLPHLMPTASASGPARLPPRRRWKALRTPARRESP